MAKIRMLSENVIGKIAAGEVVERPAAAIKELVENSLDAGAKAIQVDIQEGGIAFFRVSDDGCGIDTADMRLAFERHATSKIATEQDLNAIGTLGFRGEALASIAAVSRVTLVTRTEDQETGLKVRNEGGQFTEWTEAACARGTTITVKDLFYNVPVRRDFLKKPATEANAVSDLMTRLILSRPDVSFRYLSNGRMIYHSPGDGKIESAVLSIYGIKAVRAMRKVEGHAAGILMKGYVGIGENARSGRGGESFFINGRMLRSMLLSGAVEDACRERVMVGKYPTCALYLEMPYESVNINVHPNKMEVRFRDDQAVRQAVFSLVFDALQDRDAFERPLEMPLISEKEEARTLPDIVPPAETKSAKVEIGGSVPAVARDEGYVRPKPVLRPLAETKAADGNEADGLAGGTALLRETRSPAVGSVPLPGGQGVPAGRPAGSGAAFGGGNAGTVRPELEPDLLPPPETEAARRPEEGCGLRPAERTDGGEPRAEDVSPDGKESAPKPFAGKAEQLSALPADLPAPMKIFGAVFDTFILIEYADHLLLVDQHAAHERLLYEKMMKAYEGHSAGQEMLVPIIVSVTKREQALLEENREMLESIGLVVEPFGAQEVALRSVPMVLGHHEGAAFLRDAIEELENGKTPGAEKKRAEILQMACKHAVKGGEPLPESQLRALVEEMIDRKVTPTCPHGRPLVVSISHTELDRKFKRIQG